MSPEGRADGLIIFCLLPLELEDEEVVEAPGRWVDWDWNSCELEDIMLNAELMDWYIL